tara:strand:+ start:7411 stop:7968 length:558 start_codon:yes stop_codon:yes gene_type:complete
MIKIINELFNYLKNPILERDNNINIYYRFKVFASLLWISITISFFLSIVNGLLTSLGLLHDTKHVSEMYFNDSNGVKFLFLATIVAPIIEELIFRAPLILFKQAKLFKVAFFTISIIFAYVHIFNFEINTNVILFSPFLVAPQFFVGLIFGYIRIRFSLLWSICLHGLYNGLLVSLFLLASNGNL